MSTGGTVDAHAIAHEPSGEWLQSRPGERFSIRIPGSATNGCYSVTEILSSPGDSTPVHLHEKEDEHILVVEGTARVLYGDKTFDATAGTVVSLARGIPHAWGNPTEMPLRLVTTSTPGGVEEVLRLIATSVDQLDLAALADKYAVRLIGPPLLGLRTESTRGVTENESQRVFPHWPLDT
jgi:mannose-6-phosphate isomerase-like protein (cupin superfamily)